MNRIIKYVLIYAIMITVLTIVIFKYCIKIDTYDNTGFIMTASTYTAEAFKKYLEYDKLKDFENMKRLDYKYTKFFDFKDEEIICEYLYLNTTVIYEGSAQKRNIYAVLCKDKTIKYIRDAIGTIESIEDSYNYEEPRKDSWLNCDERETKNLELTNAQYNRIINLLKLLKLFHVRNKEYNFDEPHSEDRNVFYMEGQYYDFEKDDRFISSMIEKDLEIFLRKIIYEDSDFDWWDATS